MRRMSFALTKAQIKNKTKTVTRRNGWLNAKVGDLIQPVEKCMGLKKGDKQVKIGGPIRLTRVNREPLMMISNDDVVKEGFPKMSPVSFVTFYAKANKCSIFQEVTRLEFEYVENDEDIKSKG